MRFLGILNLFDAPTITILIIVVLVSIGACFVSFKPSGKTLKEEIENILNDYHDEGKKPNAFVTAMSWLKTNMKLTMNESDATIASLMIEGSDMGVQSLSKYLNQYKAAEEKVKDITKELISIEEKLSKDLRAYL